MQRKNTKSNTPKLTDEQYFASLCTLMRAGPSRAKNCPPEMEIIEEAVGALSATQVAKIQEHLSRCQACMDQSLMVRLAAESAKQTSVPKEVPLALRRAIESQAATHRVPSWKTVWKQGLAAFDHAVALSVKALFPVPLTAVLAHTPASHQVAAAKSGKNLRVRVPVRKETERDAEGKVIIPCAPLTKDATLARINGFLEGERRYAMAALASQPWGWDIAVEPAMFRSWKRIDPGDARHLFVVVGTRIRDVEQAVENLQDALTRTKGKLISIQPGRGVAYLVYALKGNRTSTGLIGTVGAQ